MMKLKSRMAGLVLMALTLGLGGCASLLPKPKFDPMDPNSSVVVGYFDTTELPSPFDAVTIEGQGGEDDYVTASTKGGAFWHIAVRPGYRRIRSLEGVSGTLAQKIYSYRFGSRSSNDIAIDIKTPGVHFFGSYKYIHHESGPFKKDQFEMRPIKTPSEKEVLKMVLKAMEESGPSQRYPRQIQMVKKRIAELP